MANKKRKPTRAEQEAAAKKRVRIIWIIAACVVAVGVIAIIASAVSSSSGSADSSSSAAQSTAASSDTAALTESSVSSDSARTESAASSGAASTAAALATSVNDIVVSHYADIDVQDYGTITVALSEEAAPETVKNFVNLAESGFYNGLTFHRIMDGFMIQGGDPNGDGTGGSDSTITGEFSANGITNNISHVRGAISMARSSDYDSASSQFFIVQSDSTFLDGQYAGFGFVTEGMDVVDKICQDANPTDDNGTIPKDEQPVITSITIREA